VHSPKFPHEADPGALRDAVERYDVRHPVVDDPELTTWSAYTARAWPTLVLIDPESYVVAQFAGEGHAHAIDTLLADAAPRRRERGTLRRVDVPYEPPASVPGVLRFPASAVVVGDERSPDAFLVTDTGHHSLAVLEPDGETLRRRIGSGERGFEDGTAVSATFNEPNGLCFLPPLVARQVGYDIVVADTANHALRGVDLATGRVTTLLGDGQPWRHGDGVRRLSSPWDVTWWRDQVYIAMAGIHQLWSYDLQSRNVQVAAGTGVEGLVDGLSSEAWLAQPSGLAAAADRLWIADAEVSALRWLDDDGVHTAIGQGLFEFGFRDGGRDDARMQHPLGVAVLPDDSVAVADTYNGAVRRYEPETGDLSTIVADLPEVSGLVSIKDQIVAVVSATHQLVRVPIGVSSPAIDPWAEASTRPPLEVAPGSVELAVMFSPPAGEHLDERYGPSTQLTVSASPAALLVDGAGTGTGLARRLRIRADIGGGILHVAARAASCDDDAGPGAACRMHQQDWGIPVVVRDSGMNRIMLPLGVADSP
jgi:hypothetical protein